MLELQDGAGKESVSPWIDLCDAGIWVYLEESNPTSFGPTQTHDHYSGNLYFQTRGWVSRLDQRVYFALMVSHLIGELFWKNLCLFISCYPCRAKRPCSRRRESAWKAGFQHTCPLRSVTFSITPPPHTPSARPWSPDSGQRLLKTQYTHQPESPSQQVWPGSGCWAYVLWVLVSCALTPVPGCPAGRHPSLSIPLHTPSALSQGQLRPTGWLPHSGHSA